MIKTEKKWPTYWSIHIEKFYLQLKALGISTAEYSSNMKLSAHRSWYDRHSEWEVLNDVRILPVTEFLTIGR